MVAATWVAVGPAWAEHLRREFRPAPDEIYIFDSLTAAEHRGERLSAAIFAVVAATYRGRGCRRAVGLIVPHNRSSARSRGRSGFRRVGTVRSFPRGPIRTADVLGEAHEPADR